MLSIIPFYLFFVPLTIFFAIVVIIASFFDRSGNLSNRISIFWGGLVCRLAGVRVQVDHGDFDPDGKYILMVNHQSWFDIPVLLVALRGHQFRFVAKQSLFRIPFFGQAMSRIGYIGIDRENPRRGIKSIQEAIAKSEHASILIFPEGSRFKQLGDFKIGPMILAIKSGRPVVPVLISGTYAVLPKDSWRIRPGSVAVRIFPAHDIKGAYTLKERDRLKEDIWKIMHEHSKETDEWLDKKRP
ncbi:lysophospholipid acyltransferase family protein [Desulfonatronum thiodismutans]|uniref:lysophospholipid acyltransferase family protein n=1 Tax=Desulfonatronum thiodismutans TaxID=159290 RepID=UPI0004ABE04D|nr:lysophospholipid acyltransferase family protein [Desulfonatronum thiodismutans]